MNCITFLMQSSGTDYICNVIQYKCSDLKVNSYKYADFLDFTFISNGPCKNIKSRFQIRCLRRPLLIGLVGFYWNSINTQSVHNPNKWNITYCDLWKTTTALRSQAHTASYVNMEDIQTTHVRYKEHTKKHYSNHTNLMMTEHSTNAKFYIYTSRSPWHY